MSDEELLARLRAADPAADLGPADPAHTARLLEDAMSHDVRTPPAEATHAAATGRRSPLTWLVAAAAVLVIVGAGVFAVAFRDDASSVPSATPPGTSETPPTVTELSARTPAPGRCAAPTAELLAQQQTAFSGTVLAITAGQVTLEVDRWYAGTATDRVTVTAPPAELEALLLAADFQVGQRYLVSATDGYVSVCGFTAPYSDALAAMYAEAFGG